MSRLPAALGRCALAGVLLLGVGCGQPALEGSLTELMQLRYDKVEASQAGEELRVRFFSPQASGGENTILQVTARMGGLIFTPGAYIDLAEGDPGGTQRGTISRNVFDDPRRAFPSLHAGQLRLMQEPLHETPNKIAGDFSVTFVNGIELASGRTVFGSFEATVP